MVVATVLALVGCSGPPDRAAYLDQSANSCPAVDALSAARSADPLPADFRPISVTRCTFRLALASPGVTVSSGGTAWSSAQRATGPFDDLVRALRLPPEEPAGDLVCPAVHLMPELLALTDAAGRTLVPALPGTICSTPIAEVQAAVDALDWVELERWSSVGPN
ncbi:hypothetical protein [Asanoa siamensis]|uniref:hypothetical protein n=1 Tax=Asanoa siamensis TaxID=926357 RepID=UPI001940C637|nr:hypothetical protein [Asanoa siamensis]